MSTAVYRPEEDRPLLRGVVNRFSDAKVRYSDEILKVTPNFALVAQGNPLQSPSVVFEEATEFEIYGAIRLKEHIVASGVQSRLGDHTQEFPKGSLLLQNEDGEWIGMSFCEQSSSRTIWRAPINDDDGSIDVSRAVNVADLKGIQRAAIETWDDDVRVNMAQGSDIKALWSLGLGN